MVCQGKSTTTTKYGGNTFIFRSGVNKARSFNREVETIGERDLPPKQCHQPLLRTDQPFISPIIFTARSGHIGIHRVFQIRTSYPMIHLGH